MKVFISCVAACVLLGACAATDTADSTEPSQREYRTGSNIPQKSRTGDGVQTLSAEDFERARNAATAAMKPRSGSGN